MTDGLGRIGIEGDSTFFRMENIRKQINVVFLLHISVDRIVILRPKLSAPFSSAQSQNANRRSFIS